LSKKDPHDVKGVTAPIIFDAIPLTQCIVPILHITIGIGNGILKHFLEWVDERIEKLPPDLLDSRQSVVGHQVNLEEYMEETLEEWNHEGGSELAGLLFEKTTVAELVAEQDDGGLLAMSADERAEAKVYVAGLSERIGVLQAKKKEHLDAISAIKKDIAKGKKASKALEKALGGAQIKSLR
jgi:hypothetical protein